MSNQDGDFVVRPGWYPDPADSAGLRRWDGHAWTQDVRPGPAASVAPEPEPEPAPQSTPEPEPSAPSRAAFGEPPVRKDLPEWMNQPGLILPPDLSGIEGLSAGRGLRPPEFVDAPTRSAPIDPQRPVFEEEQQPEPEPVRDPEPLFEFREPPRPPHPPAPSFAPAPPDDAADRGIRDETPAAPSGAPQSRRERRAAQEPDRPPRDEPKPESTPGRPYAPPPAGVQYIAPLPPGVDNVAPAPGAYPASSLGTRITPSWSDVPQPDSPLSTTTTPDARGSDAIAPDPTSLESTPSARFSRPFAPSTPALGIPLPKSSSTVGVWLLAILPLLQFGVIYYAFAVLRQPVSALASVVVLVAPALFGLIFAALDRHALDQQGHDRAPQLIWAIVPPLYLVVRCFRVNPRSVGALIVWLVLQAAAVIGVEILLPTALRAALGD